MILNCFCLMMTAINYFLLTMFNWIRRFSQSKNILFLKKSWLFSVLISDKSVESFTRSYKNIKPFAFYLTNTHDYLMIVRNISSQKFARWPLVFSFVMGKNGHKCAIKHYPSWNCHIFYFYVNLDVRDCSHDFVHFSMIWRL